MSIIRDKRFLVAVFLVAEIVATGMGMGVPIFNILLGFVVGWYLPRVLSMQSLRLSRAFQGVLRVALLTSSFTVLLMAVIWLPTINILIEPGRDLANFGIPMILYEPRASFIGWIVLMVLISPFLQVLTTVFGASVFMARAVAENQDDAASVTHPSAE